MSMQRFQSTFPHGERPQSETEVPKCKQVSIHVPARGTTQNRYPLMIFYHRFQSTFPHGERQCHRQESKDLRQVSIHVPARGTTSPWHPVSLETRVSIHVPARGTTSFSPADVGFAAFQSTFPHGERLQSSTNFLCAFCSYLCNYTNKFRSTQPPARFSSHFTSKSRCESPWNSMFTPDSHHSVIALLFIRNHQNIHCTTS